ncbi:MAG: hypothetical protein MZV64_04565 [Ignavibacteriales bacterium]|nr:hypothetical protein [Ignavibacteriales bacterium]
MGRRTEPSSSCCRSGCARARCAASCSTSPRPSVGWRPWPNPAAARQQRRDRRGSSRTSTPHLQGRQHLRARAASADSDGRRPLLATPTSQFDHEHPRTLARDRLGRIVLITGPPRLVHRRDHPGLSRPGPRRSRLRASQGSGPPGPAPAIPLDRPETARPRLHVCARLPAGPRRLSAGAAGPRALREGGGAAWARSAQRPARHGRAARQWRGRGPRRTSRPQLRGGRADPGASPRGPPGALAATRWCLYVQVTVVASVFLGPRGRPSRHTAR